MLKTHNKSKKIDAHFIKQKYVHILKQQKPTLRQELCRLKDFHNTMNGSKFIRSSFHEEINTMLKKNKIFMTYKNYLFFKQDSVYRKLHLTSPSTALPITI
jgi:hypothetical protein